MSQLRSGPALRPRLRARSPPVVRRLSAVTGSRSGPGRTVAPYQIPFSPSLSTLCRRQCTCTPRVRSHRATKPSANLRPVCGALGLCLGRIPSQFSGQGKPSPFFFTRIQIRWPETLLWDLTRRSDPSPGHRPPLLPGPSSAARLLPNQRLKLSAHGLGRIPFVPHCISCSTLNSGAPFGLRAAA